MIQRDGVWKRFETERNSSGGTSCSSRAGEAGLRYDDTELPSEPTTGSGRYYGARQRCGGRSLNARSRQQDDIERKDVFSGDAKPQQLPTGTPVADVTAVDRCSQLERSADEAFSATARDLVALITPVRRAIDPGLISRIRSILDQELAAIGRVLRPAAGAPAPGARSISTLVAVRRPKLFRYQEPTPQQAR